MSGQEELLRISVDDGKYTVIQPRHEQVRIERHGERWLGPGFPGSNAVLALAYELEEAREKLAPRELSKGEVNTAASAYADATGYYLGEGQLHPGLSSPSADNIRRGITAALEAVNYGALRAAAMRLYMAGRWTLPAGAAANEAALWEALRDALGLKPGTATNLEANPGATIVNGQAAMPVWGCGHDCRDFDCSGCKVVGYEPIEPMLPLDGATAGLVP